MAKFLFGELVGSEVVTARLGAGTGSSNQLGDTERGKFVKLGGDSRYVLCVAGDVIEGRIDSLNPATQDGYTIGAVLEDEDFYAVTFDGLQATPGTGTIAIGDYVVTGTVVAKGTAIASAEFARVTKATAQPGGTLADLAAASAAIKAALFAWRVVSLGSAGTGAVGTSGVIQRVG